MTNERKEELVRKIVAYAAEQGNTLIDIPRKVLQEITDDINNHIAPFNKILLPFYITATVSCILIFQNSSRFLMQILPRM